MSQERTLGKRSPTHIVIACPTCGEKLKVPDGENTIRVKCAHCSRRFLFRAKQPKDGPWSYEERAVFLVSFLGLLTLLWELDVGFLAFVGAGLGAYVSASLAHAIMVSRRQRAFEQQPCRHGVRGGVVLRTCQACIADEAASRKAEERRQKELDQLRRAAEQRRRQAAAMRQRELSRLRVLFSLNLQEFLRVSPYEFENRVASLYRAMGFRVRQTPYSGDGGFDMLAEKAGEKLLIECKQYGEGSTVGRPELQVLRAAVVDESADKGVLITTGRVSGPAAKYVYDKPIEILEREDLARLIHECRARGDESGYSAVCTTCGFVVRHSIESGRYVQCQCGDSVPPSINLDDVLV